MHIVMYADRPAGYGGIETHLATLAKDLRRLGQRVTLAFADVGRWDLFDFALDAGARVVAFDRGGFAEFCQRERPDVIHAHSHGASVAAQRVSARLGIPWAVTLHGPGQILPALRPDAEPLALICVSREIARSIGRRRRVVVIENGVDLERFSPKPIRKKGRPVRALYLGRVGPTKREGVRALQEALGSRPDVELTFVSDWAPRGDGKPTGRVEEALKGADLVFSTGRGVREAMAAGCAAFVLGSFADGLVTPEAVERLAHFNFSGRASRTAPTARRLAMEVRPLLQNPGELRRLGAFGRKHAAYAWDSRVAALHTLDLYVSGVS